MVLRTFNVNEEKYQKFRKYCQERGMSMSKQIGYFIEYVIEEKPKAKKVYLEKLDKIRKGKFTPVKNFADRYQL